MLVKYCRPTVTLASMLTAKQRLLVGSFVVGVLLPLPAISDSGVEKKLVAVAERLNQRAPFQVDADTRVDKVTVEAGPRFNYHHTMLKAKRADVDMAVFNGAFASGLKIKVCSAVQMRPLLESGVTLGYLYRASDGLNVGSIHISPKDCGL